VEEEGAVTVVSKTLIDLVNNLPSKNISLNSENGELFVDSENYHTKIKTLPAEDFPLIPSVEDGFALSVDSQELKNAIDQVFFAASTNQTQPEISGVLFAIEKQGLRIAATDRYRLAEKKLPLSKTAEPKEFILPQKTIVEVSRIIGNQKGNVEMVFSETQALVSFNETQIVSRLVDGQYPDYRQIIPSSFTTTVITEKTPLIGALKAASVFSQNTNSIKVDFSSAKQQLVLTSESSDLGKSSVELPAKISGPDVSLVLNFHYLLDCFTSIDSKNVVVKIIDDNSASLIVPEDKNDYTYLVMPIKS